MVSKRSAGRKAPPQIVLIEPMLSRVTIRGFREKSSGRINAKKLAEVTGLSVSELADVAGVPAITLERNAKAKLAQSRLPEFAHAWARLRTIFPNDEVIRKWLRHPLPGLRGKSALWLIREHGLDSFQAMIDEMLYGTNG